MQKNGYVCDYYYLPGFKKRTLKVQNAFISVKPKITTQSRVIAYKLYLLAACQVD